MRDLAVSVYDASLTSPATVSAPYPRQNRLHPSSRAAQLQRASPSRALQETVVSGVIQPHLTTSRNPIPMATQVGANLHEATQSERDLAAEIARAMHRRPLMKRLARIESVYVSVPTENGSTQSGEPNSAPILSSPAMLSQPAALTLSPAHHAPVEHCQPQSERTSPPRSAEWLGKARRQRNRERLKNALAWLSTMAIGGTIIASTVVALQA